MTTKITPEPDQWVTAPPESSVGRRSVWPDRLAAVRRAPAEKPWAMWEYDTGKQAATAAVGARKYAKTEPGTYEVRSCSLPDGTGAVYVRHIKVAKAVAS